MITDSMFFFYIFPKGPFEYKNGKIVQYWILIAPKNHLDALKSMQKTSAPCKASFLKKISRKPQQMTVFGQNCKKGSFLRIFLDFFRNHTLKRAKKRSRVRVTIEGQCVLLQISHQIKMFDILLNSQNHRMNHVFPGILLNP